MKSIQDLAREAGAAQDEGLTYFEANELQRFHDAAIAQYREGLLAGVGEPIGFWAGNPERDAQPCYTADQMAAAVLRERERIAELVEGEDVQHPKYIAAAIRGQK